ncbi:MAG: LamG-like jellyroll fold domain-containing protein, partial [Rickettsiales bacterium]
IFSDLGDDVIDGGDGDDELIGMAGDDTLLGGAGNDILTPDDETGVPFFSNTTVANMELWLDGNDSGNYTVAGSNITAITDKSPLGQGITVMSDPAVSGGALGTQDLMDFDNNDYFRVNMSLGNSYSIATVFDLASTGSYQTLMRGITNDHMVLINPAGLLGVYDNSGGTNFHSSGLDVDTLAAGAHVLVAIATPGNTDFYIDGVLVGSADASGDAAGNTTFAIGNYQGGNQPFDFGEILIFDADIGSDRVVVENYLSTKYSTATASASNDVLTGGGGDDIFHFASVRDSGVGAGNRDSITDFKQGTDADQIDFSDLALGGAGAFIGNAAFSGALELRWEQVGADTVLQIDADSDGAADMEILLENFTGTGLSAGDFIF